jgi:ABC-2 type transport system ATP-binding protein
MVETTKQIFIFVPTKFIDVSIKVENVSKFYGNQEALSHVGIEAEKGEIIGFLGPNGAGKSTLMKILTCYIPASSGQAWVAGYDVNEQPLEVKKNIGYLPEHNPLYTEMYVREFLTFTAELYNIKDVKERVDEMIELIGLTREQNKKIEELSKGYRQRVGLAAAMIHDPEVLILDEPTTGLDPNQIVEIRDLIVKIGKNKSVLLSTHIMQEVEAMCSRVIIIDKGKIITDQPTEKLKLNMTSGAVLEVEFEKEINSELLKEAINAVKIEKVKEKLYLIHSQENKDLRAAIFAWAVKENNAVLSQKEIEQSLEEVFKRLTG